MNPDDYYVDVLDAADAWFELTEQEAEPTDAEWDAAHIRLEDAVEALREHEATAGTSAREADWGGQRAATFAVIDAAIAWHAQAVDEEQPSQEEQDATLDRLGDAVRLLRRTQ